MSRSRTASGTTLPVTGDQLSPLVLGTMTFGSRVDRDEAADMVARCRDAGVTMFDTANSYNDGESERILGEVVASYRSDVLIASKVCNPVGPEPVDRGLSAPAVHKAVDASLQRLGTDYLDVYYLHKPDWQTPIEETLGAMNELVDAGKVRQLGVSNYAAWQIAEIRCLQERSGAAPVHVSQPVYNLLSRRVEDEYAACSDRYDLVNIVYNPLAGGLLTGKHADLDHPAPESRFDTGGLRDMYRQRYWNRDQFEAVARLQGVAEQAGMTLVELAFRWLLSRPLVGAILIGASSTQQLAENLDAASGGPVGDDVLGACDEVWAGLRGAAPRYNR